MTSHTIRTSGHDVIAISIFPNLEWSSNASNSIKLCEIAIKSADIAFKCAAKNNMHISVFIIKKTVVNIYKYLQIGL